LIFLKYISDAFDELYSRLRSGKGDYSGADPEDKDEYKAENVFLCQKLPTIQSNPALREKEKKLLK